MTICHVKGCGVQGTDTRWFPALGCCLMFCATHTAVPEPDRAEWIIELARAKREHDAQMDLFSGGVK